MLPFLKPAQSGLYLLLIPTRRTCRKISYAQGCDVLGDDRSGFDEAVQIVRSSDVTVVVVAGKSGLLRPVTVGEGNDATDIALTSVQQHALIDAIADTGKPLVVVVLSGRVHTLMRVAERASALLQLFPVGEEGGNGLADVLTGKVAPSGRLSVSLPRSLGQVPNYLGMRAGGDRTFFGDYADSPTAPLFPFGHGLSYTTFAYSDLTVKATSTTELISISITISNTGERPGDEVIQLYYRDEVASMVRPIRMLIGFMRVSLTPGQARRITFIVHPSRLAFYNASMRFVTEPGEFSFYIGASSQDIHAEQKMVIVGEVTEYQQRNIVATQVVVE